MGKVFYPKFPDRKGERLCNLKIEVTQVVLGIIREHCHKNNINSDSISNCIKTKIYRLFIYPLVDKIDDYEGKDVIAFEERVRHHLIFMKSKILYTLTSSIELKRSSVQLK